MDKKQLKPSEFLLMYFACNLIIANEISKIIDEQIKKEETK